MTEEHKIQNEIRIAFADSCILFRVNVGKCYTKDGRYFDTGVPKGFSDLFGFRKSDERAVFIEVKTPTGRPMDHQKKIPHGYAESWCDCRRLQKRGGCIKTY